MLNKNYLSKLYKIKIIKIVFTSLFNIFPLKIETDGSFSVLKLIWIEILEHLFIGSVFKISLLLLLIKDSSFLFFKKYKKKLFE